MSECIVPQYNDGWRHAMFVGTVEAKLTADKKLA